MKNERGILTLVHFDIPMTCFTETPVQFIEHHARTFGDFGIGMTIGWAISKRAQNVIYCEHDDPDEFGETMLEIASHEKELKKMKSTIRFNRRIMDSLFGATEQMYYRNEREWRVIGRMTDMVKREFTPTEVTFLKNDIIHLICPKSDVETLKTYVDALWGTNHGVEVKSL